MFPTNDLPPAESDRQDIDKLWDNPSGKTEDKGTKENENNAPPKEDEEEEDETRFDDGPLEDDDQEDEGKEKKEDKEDVEEDEEEDEADAEVKDETVYQSLKKLDKDIFKKVPELKSVIFRERALTEIYPTIDEAKVAKEKAEVFDAYQDDMLQGNPTPLFESLEKVDKKTLEGFVANFLPKLEEHSKELYKEVLLPHFKRYFRLAAKSNDERIAIAAKNLHYHIFGDVDLDKDAGLAPKVKDKKDEEYENRERQFEQRIFSAFSKDVVEGGKSKVMRSIKFAFKDSGMSALRQNMLADEIYKRTVGEMEGDKRYNSTMTSLWNQARSAGYTNDWKDRIINAFLSRAKPLVSKYRTKVLSEESGASDGKGKEAKTQPKRITPSGVGGKEQRSSGPVDPSKVDWEKTSDKDFLNGRVTFKK